MRVSGLQRRSLTHSLTRTWDSSIAAAALCTHATADGAALSMLSHDSELARRWWATMIS